MKKLLIAFVFQMFIVNCSAQVDKPESYLGVLPLKNSRIFYGGTDSVPELKKDQLFDRAKTFLSKMFPNFKDVVKLDDRDLGKVVVRGLFNTKPKGNGIIVSYIDFYATATVMVKDGKYRYEISDFIKPSPSYNVSDFGLEQMMFNRKTAEKRSPMIDDVMQDFISALNAAMKSDKQDW